jgi:precorrin-2 dehydrogenase
LSSVRSRLSGEKKGLFPVFLKLNEQRCLVVGAGKTAEEKIPTLLECGARVIVVAPAATPKIRTWARTEKLVWMQRPFDPQDLNDALLCVVATSSKPVNRAVFQEAQQHGILCNVVHDGANCNFYYPAVVRRGPLQIAISTAGHSGALAQRLRQELEYQFGPEWETWLRWLGEARSALYEDPLSPRQRRTLLHKLAGKKKQEEFFRRWGADSPETRLGKRKRETKSRA